MDGIQQHSAFVSSRHAMGFPFKAEFAPSESGIEDTSRTGFSLSTSPWASDIPSLEEQDPSNPPGHGLSTSVDSYSQAIPSVSTPLDTDISASRSPRLIHHLPLAEHSAFDTFEVLDNNLLYDKSLGCSHQSLDTMICDCQYDPCSDDGVVACGISSQCINRLTQVECLANECPTRNACQNQRFQRKQYANVEIVKTEKKGYGLRAAANIRNDDFVYEYVGEVIPEDIFRSRIKEYADEGIEHFYFMMLQKGEYIDATKRGGTARFLNHSCEPNCYVAKWVVGRRMRMGIFTKREIMRGEELTFNYNVDRYGYDAQPCYCGEPNCLGTIGGKTQTDLRLMDPLYLEAMGHREEDTINKVSRRRKEITVNDIELNDLHPLELADAQKFVAAMRQAVNQGHKDIVTRLLHRVKITPTAEVDWSMIMSSNGLITWRQTLDMLDPQEPDDEEILHSTFHILDKWQPTRRNKLLDTGLQLQIQEMLPRLSSRSASVAKQLLTRWQDLPVGYTIPRKEFSTEDVNHRPIADEDDTFLEPRWKEEQRPIDFQLAPVVRVSYTARPMARGASLGGQTIKSQGHCGEEERAQLELILASASKHAQPEIASTAKDPTPHRRARRDIEGQDRKHKRPRVSSADEKDRRLRKLVSELVKQRLSMHKTPIDRETYKKHARECTDLVVKKEKRSESYAGSSYDSLSDDKQRKMKLFIDPYVCRLIEKLGAMGKLQTHGRENREPSDTPPNRRACSSPPDSNSTSHNEEMLSSGRAGEPPGASLAGSIGSIDIGHTPVESPGVESTLYRLSGPEIASHLRSTLEHTT